MNWQREQPPTWPVTPGVVIIEGQPGEARKALVAAWLTERRTGDGSTLRLNCRPGDGGAWAGLTDLFTSLVPTLRNRAPELVSAHSRELCLVVPALRSELHFPESLADTADDEEQTRNYAADRAYRCLHGLIDLLSEWHELSDAGSWSIACDGYHEANGLVRRFFAELVRRRGSALGLRLLLVADPGAGDRVAAELAPAAITATLRLTLPRTSVTAVAPESMSRIALELEHQLVDGRLTHDQLPRLIEAWQRSDAPDRCLRWQVTAMARFNHAGLYEAGLPYAAAVEAGLERLAAENRQLYLAAANALYFCYVTLGHAEAALPIVAQALEHADATADLARFCYLLSMLHARFLRPNDQDAAESYLQRALSVLADGDLPDPERQFLTVFMMNGLALVRLRQGRVPEALQLCSDGVTRLNTFLDPERHRLHRSVLLFNIAQVHAQIGPHEAAVEYFSQAMAMDPNYSEYYNDRGALYFRTGRMAEAESDYLRAIELSSPYAEVWTNLGQCYRAMERMDDAVRAYSRAIDLDPSSTLALVGRADAHAELDYSELALVDYDRALTLDGEQPLVLASRAVLHYQGGRLHAALDDLDAAVRLAPDIAELHQNRAAALAELGRPHEAIRDLRTYLKFCPDAEDRDEVEALMSTLASTAERTARSAA